ncbi:MAG: hypothetical protein ABIQ32_11990 [Sphingomicrobium sp.]
MSGSSRSVGVAFAGLALLFTIFGLGWISGYGLNDPQPERYQPYRDAADKPVEIEPALTRPSGTQALQNRTPCEDPKGREESDLCAQWKAANAAEDGARWTKYGFWIGVVGSIFLAWQIILTRQAVEDTGHATEAMRKANAIAENAQRAWVRLGCIPKLVRKTGLNGLYFRVDFTAENTGGSAATHFMLYHRIFFRAYGELESGDRAAADMREEVETWRSEHSLVKDAALLPQDKDVSADWKTFDEEEIKWRDKLFIGDVAQPMLLAAAIYRTVSEPNVWQVTWRTWYLATIGEDGQLVTCVPKTDLEGYGPDRLCADPYHRSASHEQYAVENGKPVRD